MFKSEEEVTFQHVFKDSRISLKTIFYVVSRKKVRLLLSKFKTTKQEKYVNYILPKNPRDISFHKNIFLIHFLRKLFTCKKLVQLVKKGVQLVKTGVLLK